MTDAPLLALGGPPGSGKSTAAKGVAEALHLTVHSAGDLFRGMAAERHMSLVEFSWYAQEHPEVDLEIDEKMAGLAEPGRVLEGRLVGEFLRRRGTSALWVDVTASEPVRAERIARRDHLTVAEALERTRAREKSERVRYAKLYGIDLDSVHPDLLIDSSELGPGEVVDRILAFARRPRAGSS
ncbi:MAG: (d)CMP kinase [Thermoplasmata archaeon]|nr:(d)CMP kinase [Thermoplasmata archaeon]